MRLRARFIVSNHFILILYCYNALDKAKHHALFEWLFSYRISAHILLELSTFRLIRRVARHGFSSAVSDIAFGY